MIKLNKDYLKQINDNNDVLKKFGNWINNIDILKNDFIKGIPFEHIVIDNFLNDEYAEEIYKNYPKLNDNWHTYLNPLEVKYTFDNIHELDKSLNDYFYYLSSDIMITIIKQLTMIDTIQYDEYLHGAGLHIHPNNGRLNVHLDYEKHPYSGKERKLNIIYFSTKDWDPSWNGSNELWDKNVSNCVKKTDIKFNRAIIFRTNDISWHGLHEKICCPDNIYRKSIAYYYMSELNNTNKEDIEYRTKAKFTKPIFEPYCEKMYKLYKIRENRLITKNDLNEIMPEWKI
jgi:Rps23 Pro-64 3,4-dihydroxylase Tpa1-like proline 4-hydroxylase